MPADPRAPAGRAADGAADPPERPPDDDRPSLGNGDLAAVFHEIGDLLEVKGELVFKTVAYHRAADAIGRAPIDVARAFRAGERPEIPGVGKAIADKIDELARTGRLAFLDRLRAEFPATLVDLLGIPGLGPKTVKLVYEQIGIATLDELRAAAVAGRLRGLRGISQRTEALIVEGIDGLRSKPDRMLLDRADELVRGLIDRLSDTPGLTRLEPAGSFRRRRESIGDLDLLAETTDGATLVERFTGSPDVAGVLQRGPHKAAVRLRDGPQVDLMIMPPDEAGTYLVHFTGSKEHNVRLRERARDRGWSLSEKGFVAIGDDGEPLTGTEARLITFPTEAEVYAFLDLATVPPELREDGGEIEAAISGSMPALVDVADLRGDCHSHSDWSDGTQPIEVMAEAARARGYAYLVLTDHSQSLAIARGLDPDRVERQRTIIARLNERFAAEEDDRTAPAAVPDEGFRLLHGCELEVRADGRLDYEDELLARFDVVVASVHVARRQSRAELTARTLAAIHNPHVDIVAHPAGRKIGDRPDLDLDWDTIFREAAATGTALEINGSPHRLDLSAERARRAVAAGCLVTIDSDAHRIHELDYVRWGVGQARRAWIEPATVLNTRTRAEFLDWVRRNDPGHVPSSR